MDVNTYFWIMWFLAGFTGALLLVLIKKDPKRYLWVNSKQDYFKTITLREWVFICGMGIGGIFTSVVCLGLSLVHSSRLKR